MAYWERQNNSSPSLDTTSTYGQATKKQATADAFYEIEPAIVLDIILDKDHKYFQSVKFKLNPDQWPISVEKKAAEKTDLDYTWMGRALVRLLNTQRTIEKEDCVWALPLESNISEYPVINEVVGVVFYLGQYFYTKKINIFNVPNSNPDFNLEIVTGGFRKDANSPMQGNRELLISPSDSKKPYVGPESIITPQKTYGYYGVMGRYFLYNNRIRAIKRREGDLIIESRFGQSIRFAAYDDNRDNDKGYLPGVFDGYDDYKGNKIINPYCNKEAGGGNPMILIRNRQRPLAKEGQQIKVYDKIPPVVGTAEEKNVGGYILEDINNDGTSIHITSGITVSGFLTNCYKQLWGLGEEQSKFNGTTNFKWPTLIGDQIVVNSDRVIISAKKSEMFQYAKKRMAFVTDDEYTVDAHNQIVLTTNNKTVINSPAIYLGEYDQTNEPALLGQTSVNWLYDLCKWLEAHTHWYRHSHPDAGQANPDKTQTPVQVASLIVLREKLNLLMSRRVFVVGGGLAPGANGGSITNGAAPVSITIPSGTGVPGGWSGMNRKYNAAEKAAIESSKTEVKNTAIQASTSVTTAVQKITEIEKTIDQIKDIRRQYQNNSTIQQCLDNANKKLRSARINVQMAQEFAQKAQAASDRTEQMDNELLIAEEVATAKNAADKAKYYADQADKNSQAVKADLAIAQNVVNTLEK